MVVLETLKFGKSRNKESCGGVQMYRYDKNAIYFPMTSICCGEKSVEKSVLYRF